MMRSTIAVRSETPDAPADIYIDETGNLAMAFDAQAVGQHARQRILTFLGEWYLDITIGVDWFGQVLGRQTDPILIEALVKAEIIGTDGVTEITSFSVGATDPTRGLLIKDIQVRTDYDEVVSL